MHTYQSLVHQSHQPHHQQQQPFSPYDNLHYPSSSSPLKSHTPSEQQLHPRSIHHLQHQQQSSHTSQMQQHPQYVIMSENAMIQQQQPPQTSSSPQYLYVNQPPPQQQPQLMYSYAPAQPQYYTSASSQPQTIMYASQPHQPIAYGQPMHIVNYTTQGPPQLLHPSYAAMPTSASSTFSSNSHPSVKLELHGSSSISSSSTSFTRLLEAADEDLTPGMTGRLNRKRKSGPTSSQNIISLPTTPVTGKSFHDTEDMQQDGNETDDQMNEEEEQQQAQDDDYEYGTQQSSGERDSSNISPQRSVGPALLQRDQLACGSIRAPNGANKTIKFRSIIQCGATDPSTGMHQLTLHLDYFGCAMDVYTAECDAQHRVLVRASTLADKFHCATNKIGMYLARRRTVMDGIFQAIDFTGKPAGKTGLKVGGYFLSLNACQDFESHFWSHKDKKGNQSSNGSQGKELKEVQRVRRKIPAHTPPQVQQQQQQQPQQMTSAPSSNMPRPVVMNNISTTATPSLSADVSPLQQPITKKVRLEGPALAAVPAPTTAGVAPMPVAPTLTTVPTELYHTIDLSSGVPVLVIRPAASATSPKPTTVEESKPAPASPIAVIKQAPKESTVAPMVDEPQSTPIPPITSIYNIANFVTPQNYSSLVPHVDSAMIEATNALNKKHQPSSSDDEEESGRQSPSHVVPNIIQNIRESLNREMASQSTRASPLAFTPTHGKTSSIASMLASAASTTPTSAGQRKLLSSQPPVFTFLRQQHS